MLLVRCQIKGWCCQSAVNTVKGVQRKWLVSLKQKKKRLHVVYLLVRTAPGDDWLVEFGLMLHKQTAEKKLNN